MLKDSVLTILRNEKGYISGETISSLLGVSRTAVNTAVKALRAEGYEILSSTRKGYLLDAVPNCLTAVELSAWLSQQRMQSVLCVDCVDSTNNRLRDLALSGAPDGQVVIAGQQLRGRGRRGRDFVSSKDKGIYLSMLFRPDSLPSHIMEITAWTAVAVNNAIERVCGIRAGIKWVNDLVIHQKKVCGILTEMSVESESGYVQYVVIGVGINVNESEEDFPKELKGIATSLSMETGAQYPRARLASEIIRELDLLRSVWPHGKQKFLESYRRDNITLGKEICIIRGTEEKQAIAHSIGEDFSLNIRCKDGSLERISSGEVTIRGLYGGKRPAE